MQILDLRPRTVRFVSSLWGRNSTIRGGLDATPDNLNFITRGMNGIADRLIARRIAGRTLKDGCPAIVSVGNLALGGTGKTPVVATLASDLAAAGWRGAVLTRGFGSPLSGPLAVERKNVLAGDEARLMASVLGPCGWPVVQARKRSRGLDFLLDIHPETEIVIVEDGHQTAHLGRHLDVVILDAWTTEKSQDPHRVHAVTGAVFPFGPWRESANGAGRAGIWLLETDAEVPAGGVNGQSVATFNRRLSLRDAHDESCVERPAGRCAVLSGIARPEAFEKALQKIICQEPQLSIRYGDHADYTPRDTAKMMGAMKEAGSDFLVTTAKDWVKLEPFWSRGPRVLVADLEIQWGHDKTLPELVGDHLGALGFGKDH